MTRALLVEPLPVRRHEPSGNVALGLHPPATNHAARGEHPCVPVQVMHDRESLVERPEALERVSPHDDDRHRVDVALRKKPDERATQPQGPARVSGRVLLPAMSTSTWSAKLSTAPALASSRST